MRPMSVFKRSTTFVLATATAAAVAGLFAAPAFAGATFAGAAPASATPAGAAPAGATSASHRPWHITRGRAIVAFAHNITVEDTTAGRRIPCRSSTLKIRLKSGRRLSGANAGKLTSASFGGCTTLNGYSVRVSLGHLPWHLNLASYNAAKGVTTGTLTGLHLAIRVPFLGCTAVADGTSAKAHNGVLAATYSNKTHRLTALRTGGSLRVYDVRNCYGVINNGDSITLSASYAVRPSLKITGR
jgi:hypothetical protein